MEKSQTQYLCKKPKVWRNTLDEESFMFKNVIPSIREKTKEDMKNNEKDVRVDPSEANVFKSFPINSISWVSNTNCSEN